ncbi:MAG: beta-galactosidase, partial [Tannerella sp.]|nr:beta-galactosidase [Tannerella sp.]
MKNKFFSKIVLLLSVSLCAVNFLFAQFIQTNPIDVFKFDKDEFLLNGKPFQIIAGEMHPPRIPEQYWKHRIQMAKAMGCNTIALYVFWNYHEPEPGVFDFKTENRDLARFIRMAKEEGMWVILRPGPYSCGEWDFGGLPPYLLSVPDIKIRCMDSDYTKAVERYVKNLVLQIKELQVTQGGPILMLQLENEYGSYGNDRDYMFWMKDLWRKNGIDIPFYTSDGVGYHWLEAGSLPDAATGLNPGVNANDFSVAAEVNPNVPSLCSELYTGWLTHWGEPFFQKGDSIALLNNVKWLMDNKKSFSLYVIHGGTNFGYWAGANSFGKDQYQPDITSYDYDAPINEMGQATPKYYALRNLLASYLPKKQKLPAVPAALPIIEIPEITFTSSSSVWDHLPVAIPSVQPKPMEMFGQKFG